MEETRTEVRICVGGDELVAGVGDARCLGWTGRVGARTDLPGGQLTVFALGVPGEGTGGLLQRWDAETSRRFGPDADNRLVIGLGTADLELGTSLARSRLALANVLDDATSRGVHCFVVGPTPSPEPAVADRIRELSAAFDDVCDRRAVPFVDCYGPLASHDQWYGDLGDDGLPGQSGYGLMAWLVLHGGWHTWLDLPQR